MHAAVKLSEQDGAWRRVGTSENHECVLGSLYWVGYVHWPICFFLFQKRFKDIYIKICDGFINSNGKKKVHSFCVATITNHHTLKQLRGHKSIILTVLKFCISPCTHQHMWEVWHVSQQANIKVSAELGSLFEGFRLLFQVVGRMYFLAAVGLRSPFYCCLSSEGFPWPVVGPLPLSSSTATAGQVPSSVASFWLFLGHPISLTEVEKGSLYVRTCVIRLDLSG